MTGVCRRLQNAGLHTLGRPGRAGREQVWRYWASWGFLLAKTLRVRADRAATITGVEALGHPRDIGGTWANGAFVAANVVPDKGVPKELLELHDTSIQ